MKTSKLFLKRAFIIIVCASIFSTGWFMGHVSQMTIVEAMKECITEEITIKEVVNFQPTMALRKCIYVNHKDGACDCEKELVLKVCAEEDISCDGSVCYMIGENNKGELAFYEDRGENKWTKGQKIKQANILGIYSSQGFSKLEIIDDNEKKDSQLLPENESYYRDLIYSNIDIPIIDEYYNE